MRLFTVGHGTLAEEELTTLVRGARVEAVVDVRTAPGSRRSPHLARAELARWLPEAGLSYRWERDLGGFRRPRPDSPNTALRNASFRGYADHMATPTFVAALARLLEDAAGRPTAAMCSEALWWRCHRRLVADAATLLHGVEVVHLAHDGRLEAHRVTDGARREGDLVLYDGGQPALSVSPPAGSSSPRAVGSPARGAGPA